MKTCIKTLFLFLALNIGAFGQASSGEYADSLHRDFAKASNDSARFKAAVNLAYYFIPRKRDSAQRHLEKSRALAARLDNAPARAQLHILEAKILNGKGEYKAALAHLQEARREIPKLENKLLVAHIFQTEANLYRMAQDFEQALQSAREAQGVLKGNEDALARQNIYQMIADAYYELYQNDSALFYYEKTLNIYRRLGDEEKTGQAHNGMAIVYEDMGDYDLAMGHYEKALEILEKYGARTAVGITLTNMGHVRYAQGQYAESLRLIRRAHRIIETMNLPNEEMWTSESLANAYYMNGQGDSSFYYLKQHYLLKDSVLAAQKLREFDQQRHQYEQAALKAELENEATLERQSLMLWIFGLGGLLLVAALLGGLLYQRNRKNHIEKELQTQRAARAEAEREKEQLKTERLEEELVLRNQGFALRTMHLAEKNEVLKEVSETLKELNADGGQAATQIRRKIKSHIQSDNDWEEFKTQFENINPGFFQNLLERNSNLTARDLRIAAYLRMNLTTKEMARVMNYTVRGVETNRYRLRKKLEIPTETDLNLWMMRV